MILHFLFGIQILLWFIDITFQALFLATRSIIIIWIMNK